MCPIELSDLIRSLTGGGAQAGALATLVTVAGSSYRRPGARLLLRGDGSRVGSISGGCLEEDVIARSARVIQTRQAELVTYDTRSENDLVWGVGLGCHGVVQVLIEPVAGTPDWVTTLAENLRANRTTVLDVTWQAPETSRLGTSLAADANDASAPLAAGVFRNIVTPPPRLAIFGAGDDARPLHDLAKGLGWHVTVADPRPDFTTAARFPSADRLVIAPPDELVARAALPPNALAVVMTHRYLHDVPVLRHLLPLDLPYLGLLGPRQRAERLLADLAAEGLELTPDQRARFHAPVGLDLGANTPAEVALSIVAEMRAALGRRDARPLRLRAAPIHGAAQS